MERNGKMSPEEHYAYRREPSGGSKIVPFALGVVIGGVIGAAFALLYAPAEGAELRRGMSETLDDLVGGAKDILKSAKTSAEKLFSEGLAAEDEDEEDSPMARTREKADDILEDADRAIAEARRRTSSTRKKHEEDEE